MDNHTRNEADVPPPVSETAAIPASNDAPITPVDGAADVPSPLTVPDDQLQPSPALVPSAPVPSDTRPIWRRLSPSATAVHLFLETVIAVSTAWGVYLLIEQLRETQTAVQAAKDANVVAADSLNNAVAVSAQQNADTKEQLKIGREGVAASVIAATASRDANRANRDALQTELRAWVLVANLEAEGFQRGTLSVSGRLTITNMGPTPALDVSLGSLQGLVGALPGAVGLPPRPTNLRISPASRWIAPTTAPVIRATFQLAPPSSESSPATPGVVITDTYALGAVPHQQPMRWVLADSDYDALRSRAKFLHVQGAVSYRDVFGGKHETPVCYAAQIELDPTTQNLRVVQFRPFTTPSAPTCGPPT